MTALGPIGHDDRLSVVEHLDELRSRLIVCGIVLLVAFGVCFWQNQSLLRVLNRALPHSSSAVGQHGLSAVPNQAVKLGHGLAEIARGAAALKVSPGLSAEGRQAAAQIQQGALHASQGLPESITQKEKPITIGIGEPFMTTLMVCAYFALMLTLPVILYEGYAFVIPALKPHERSAALPMMSLAPVLFIAGVAFAYVWILPPAVHFLQGYNGASFDILVQAKTYYSFEILTMLMVGLAFQLPLGLLALQRLGVINSHTLTRQWRYGLVIIAIIAAAMPGPDPVTTALETTPLLVLYAASIVLLKIADRRAGARVAADLAKMGDSPDPA